MRLNKAMHGLKEAAADWYTFHHSRLLAFDPELEQSVAQPCFYYKVKGDMHFYLLVHVDDYALRPFGLGVF